MADQASTQMLKAKSLPIKWMFLSIAGMDFAFFVFPFNPGIGSVKRDTPLTGHFLQREPKMKPQIPGADYVAGEIWGYWLEKKGTGSL